MGITGDMKPPSVLTRWLTAASVGVALLGLSLLLVPGLALQGFSLLVYGNPGRLQALGSEAAHDISLVHAVLARGRMFGWGLKPAAVVPRLLAQGPTTDVDKTKLTSARSSNRRSAAFASMSLIASCERCVSLATSASPLTSNATAYTPARRRAERISPR